MESAHAQPDSSPNRAPKTEWNPERSTEVTQYSGVMMALPMSPKKENTQAP
jgi:hypothetical protein